MTEETSAPWWKRIGAREWLTIGMTVFGLVVWALNLQFDTKDHSRQLAEIRERQTIQDARIAEQEKFNREYYVPNAVLKPTLDSIEKRVENIETYMRRITQ